MYEVEHEVKPELSFDPSGGTWADGGSDVRKYEAGLETEFDVIDAPKRDGYTFVCWKGSEYQPGQKYHADSDHVFTAEWKKNEGGNPSNTGDSGTGDKGGSDSGTSNKSNTNTSGSGSSATNAQKTSTNSTSKTPSTGDPVSPMLLPLLLMASGGVLAVIAGKRIREL